MFLRRLEAVDAHHHPLAALHPRLQPVGGLGDLALHPVAETLAAAGDEDADSALVDLRELALERDLEEPHQAAYLSPRSPPVLGREGIDREDLHAELVARVHRALDRLDPRPVAVVDRAAPRAGPAAVAVHDDRDVMRDALGRHGGKTLAQTAMISCSFWCTSASMSAAT